jgi:hypothetical protein
LLTIAHARALSRHRKVRRALDRRGREATAYPGVPVWMHRCQNGLSTYGAITFLWLFVLSDESHSRPTAVAAVRAFSSVWMVFYGAAFMRLYSSVWKLRRMRTYAPVPKSAAQRTAVEAVGRASSPRGTPPSRPW